MRKTHLFMLVMVVAMLLALRTLNTSASEASPEPSTLVSQGPTPQLSGPKATYNRTTQRQRQRSYKERLEETCENALFSGFAPMELALLEHLRRPGEGMTEIFTRCEFDPDDVADVLTEELAPRIEEGDTEAAKLAYALAGAECMDTPASIDTGCAEPALEGSSTLTEWRTCLREGYEDYTFCTDNVLRDYDLSPERVKHLYFGTTRTRANELLDKSKDDDEAVDEVIDLLDNAAQDRAIVESMSCGQSGEIANKLFSLSWRLMQAGDTERKAEVDALLLFWGSRSQLEQVVNDGHDTPFDPTQSWIAYQPPH